MLSLAQSEKHSDPIYLQKKCFSLSSLATTSDYSSIHQAYGNSMLTVVNGVEGYLNSSTCYEPIESYRNNVNHSYQLCFNKIKLV